jgi:uncharacterized membrane protein
MKNYWILRVLGALVLLVGIVAVGYVAYNAGLAQSQSVVPAAQYVAPWHGGMEGHAWGGLLALPFLLCLVPFFLIFFIFMPLRMIFGSHRMHMHMHGRWHGEEGEVPSPVEEWHRRMHEKQDKGV